MKLTKTEEGKVMAQIRDLLADPMAEVVESSTVSMEFDGGMVLEITLRREED